MFIHFQADFQGANSRDNVLINLKKQSISIAINTFTVYTFDLKGRLISTFEQGHFFRRGLDNRVMEKWTLSTNGEKRRARHWLHPKDKRKLLNRIHYEIWKLFCILQQNQLEIIDTSTADAATLIEEVLRALIKILDFDFFGLENDSQKFSSIYRPIGILPPDMYLSLILQATEGCTYNQCNYCEFYKDRPFRVKSETEFRQHIEAVKSFLGDSISLRKFLFLGEANALDIAQAKLLTFFEIMNQEFCFSEDNGNAKPQVNGIYSFISALYKNQKSADDFAELRAKNLRRVYIGMETGCDNLLAFLNKPGSVERTLKLVEAIKKGGVDVGVIILLGAGGGRFYDDHVTDTVAAVRSMDLGKGDMVFFSPIIQHPDTEYFKLVTEQKIRSLREQEMEEQKQDMIEGFGFDRKDSPKFALYDINEFIY